MRYFVRIGDLGRKIEYLEKQLDVISENIDNLIKVKSTIIWEGDASSEFYDVYDNYILELKTIAQNTIEFIEYLSKYHDRYSTTYGELRNKYASLYSDYDGEDDLWD